jgi:hypothetical protein
MLRRRRAAGPPRRWLPRRAADDGVCEADREEVRAPVTRRVGGELHVRTLVRHAGHDEADAGLAVEPLAHEAQLRRVVAHEHGGQRGAEAAAARVELYGVDHGLSQVEDFSSSKTRVYVVRARVLNAPMAWS